MMLMAEGIFLLLYAGALLGPFLWIVLGLATYAANTRSRDSAYEEVVGAVPSAPPVTRFGRPAKIVALVIAGLLCVAVLSTAVSYFTRFDQTWAGLLGYSMAGLYIVQFVLILALAVLLVVVLWDVRVGHKRAGRDTGVAYGIIAALHVVQLGAFIALVMSGGQML